MSTPPTTDPLALAAVEGVRSGMLVGLGTGRAAARGVRALAQRVASERLDITCVSTSQSTTQLALSLGLRVVDFAQVNRVDFLFDGADEVDPQLRMLKGGGGAMTRERIVASAAMGSGCVRVTLIDHTKLVARLGERMPLPIEVIPMALASVRAQLAQLDLIAQVRVDPARGSDYLTDNHNLVLDCPLPSRHSEHAAPQRLAQRLNAIPGIVDHGLFVIEAQTVLVESPQGIRTLVREREVRA